MDSSLTTYSTNQVRKHLFKLAGLALALTAAAFSNKPSHAATVEWTGAVANTCVVTLNSNGMLGVSINGQSMSSEQTTGQAASVAVMSTGPNVVTFGNPAMTLWSPSYTGTPLIQTKQRSNKGHSGTWQATAHQATITSGDTLFEVHAQIDDPSNAFPMGAYKVSSEVTCAPAN